MASRFKTWLWQRALARWIVERFTCCAASAFWGKHDHADDEPFVSRMWHP